MTMWYAILIVWGATSGVFAFALWLSLRSERECSRLAWEQYAKSQRALGDLHQEKRADLERAHG